MIPSPLLPKNGRAYVSTVIIAGFLAVTWSAHQLTQHPVGFQWFLLAALTLVSGSATVKLPSVPASISISETFVFAAVLLYGPSAGTLIVALDGLVISFWISKRRQEPYRALFNMSAPAVSAWCASQIFFWLAGIRPLVEAPAPINQVLPALVVFAIAYFALNSWLIAFAIALEKETSPTRVWRENFIWLSLNYFCGASVAVLLVLGTRQVDLSFIGVIVPLLLVLYFTFKTSMDRVEDANRHVEKVNRLYLSTIETLAMAIDAKDQVTHGHIRRVQRCAVGLARELGVADSSLLKAIEAAALLHDMGKLAVPEYILNKPGKLTEAEFERMKLHASVGADILSAIDFPYPVVPIVRHHHESWDGTGYPGGLRGTEIPIGARILAVVDCFDALTSDRPYRRRLADCEALDILNQRKGTMYDPWVVHTFERVYKTLDSTIVAQAEVPEPQGALSERRASLGVQNAPEPMGVVGYDLTVADRLETAAAGFREEFGAALSIFYLYDIDQDDLVAARVSAEAATCLIGRRVPLGQNLSGWVAANRQAIANSDAALDLGGFADGFSPRLAYCLAVPLVLADGVAGVLSFYSEARFQDGADGVCRHRVESVFAGGTTPPQQPARTALVLQAAR